MKKQILFFVVLLLSTVCMQGQEQDLEKTLKILDETLKKRDQYIQKKEQRIAEIKKSIKQSESVKIEYIRNKQLISEYITFSCDSAIAYIERNVEIANLLNDKKCKDESLVMLAKAYTYAGLFTEALQLLEKITPSDLSGTLQNQYYLVYYRYYHTLSKYTNDPKYGSKYKEKMLIYLDLAKSDLSKVNSTGGNMENIYDDFVKNNYNLVISNLSKEVLTLDPETHRYAIVTSCLAYAYIEKGEKPELQKLYLAKAAITDAKLAIKDHSALLNLSILLHADSDSNFDRAYKYIRIAIDDANYYNSRHRNSVIVKAFPIIEKSYLNRIGKQKKAIVVTLVIVSILAVGLLFTSLYIYKQIQAVTRARRSLIQLNKKLDEANLIKEEYIGYFLNQCSIYVNKLDEYKQHIYRKIKSGQIDDLMRSVSSTANKKKDVEELYSSFDIAFLKLYPNFVEDFNNLLKEEERYKPKLNELNTELRIFALIRLGITDNKQISSFLRYSIQTIYNYRSKVKGKALNEDEDFEEKVRNIAVLPVK